MQNSIKKEHKLILKQLNKTRLKYAVMKTPYWERKMLRPIVNGNQAILSYEIYHLKTYPNEHITVRTLNELVEENKADVFLKDNFVWYVAK